MIKEPNIFNFATSELSQDAFIAWLLCWADATNKALNNQLHQLGLDFLQSLLVKQKIGLTEISNLEIKTQFHKIDVFVSFIMDGKTYGVIIEDKVHTIDHTNQLARYVDKVEKLNSETIIIPIYFKTGYQVNLTRVLENGYHYYTVKDLLKVLTQIKIVQIDNDVLTQYHSYVLGKEQQFDHADIESKLYLNKSLSEWKWWSFVSFFYEYKNHFKAGWGSVGNNREPLIAFWFGNAPLTIINEHNIEIKIEIYMDILYSNHNGMKVNYRLSLLGNTQTNAYVRNKVFHALQPFFLEKGITCKRAKFTKAKQTIKLAQVTNLDKTLKYKAFVKQLEIYNSVVSAFINEYSQ
tara:strand:+ start:350 stop:1399 length:1050 start_codon:yes stop_codon:yes gene_type:complete